MNCAPLHAQSGGEAGQFIAQWQSSNALCRNPAVPAIEAIGACEAHFPGAPIALSAQSHLEKFYRSLGFSPTSEEYVEDGIPHIDMLRPA